MEIYKVVRTYDDKDDTTNDLQKAFNEGWQFVRVSEYVPAERHGRYTRYGYIEYILSKEEEEPDYMSLPAYKAYEEGLEHGIREGRRQLAEEYLKMIQKPLEIDKEDIKTKDVHDDTKECPFCGRRTSDPGNFCSNCGHAYDAANWMNK